MDKKAMLIGLVGILGLIAGLASSQSTTKQHAFINPAEACNSTVLTGEFSPKNQEAGTWLLDATAGTAVIELEDTIITGDLSMSCPEGEWRATLKNASDGVHYSCFAALIDNSLVDGLCYTNYDKVIEVSGKLSSD